MLYNATDHAIYGELGIQIWAWFEAQASASMRGVLFEECNLNCGMLGLIALAAQIGRQRIHGLLLHAPTMSIPSCAPPSQPAHQQADGW